MFRNGRGGTKPQLELNFVDDRLPLPLQFCSTSGFSNSTFLVTVIANNVMAHLGTLLHSFNFTKRDMALLQRNKHGFQRDNAEPILLRQVIKGPHPALLYINKPEKTAFAMVILPLKKETPFIAIVSVPVILLP